MSGLSDYIKDLLKKGYDANSIRANLVSYGYNISDINQAFSEIYSNKLNSSHGINKNIYYLLGVLAVGIVIIAVVLLLFGGEEELPPPVIPMKLQAEISIYSETVRPGTYVKFDLDINSNTAQRAQIKYQIFDFDAQDDEPLIEKSESGVFNGGRVITKKIALFGLDRGEYLLKVTLDADSGTTMKSRRFSIGIPKDEKEEIEFECDSSGDCKDSEYCSRGFCEELDCNSDEEIKNHECVVLQAEKEQEKEEGVTRDDLECSKNSDCLYDEYCESGECILLKCNLDEYIDNHECVAEEDTDDEVDDVYTDDQNINDIIELSKEDKEKAMDLCTSIDDLTDKESCISRLAEEVSDSSVCENIDTTFTRDACYANFALEGDFSVCSKIYDEYQRSICEAIASSQ